MLPKWYIKFLNKQKYLDQLDQKVLRSIRLNKPKFIILKQKIN